MMEDPLKKLKRAYMQRIDHTKPPKVVPKTGTLPGEVNGLTICQNPFAVCTKETPARAESAGVFS
jgi:hypothetical protein